jgi:CMP-N,N'-diacetyllegionaminic acid synthase
VDYLVDMDVTVPLKTGFDIEMAIQLAQSRPDVDVVITGYEPERNPYFNMMELADTGYAQIVKKSEKPIVRRQDAPIVYSLSPAAYVIKKSALYEFEHWSKANCLISPMPRERAIDIDTEFDFQLIEFILQNKN